MSRFLWMGSSMDPHKAKVAWKNNNRPKAMGGNGLKRVTEWNWAVMLKHILNSFSDHDDAMGKLGYDFLAVWSLFLGGEGAEQMLRGVETTSIA